MKLGSIVKVIRVTYDSNGERWPCETTGIIVEMQENEKMSVLFSDGENRVYNTSDVLRHYEQEKDESE